MKIREFDSNELFGLEHPVEYDATRAKRLSERRSARNLTTTLSLAGLLMQAGCWSGVVPLADVEITIGFFLSVGLGLLGGMALSFAFQAFEEAEAVEIPAPRVSIEDAIDIQRRNLEIMRAHLRDVMVVALQQSIGRAAEDAVARQYELTNRLGYSLRPIKSEVQQLAANVGTIVGEVSHLDDSRSLHGKWTMVKARTLSALRLVMGKAGYSPFFPEHDDSNVLEALSRYGERVKLLLRFEQLRETHLARNQIHLAVDQWRKA